MNRILDNLDDKSDEMFSGASQYNIIMNNGMQNIFGNRLPIFFHICDLLYFLQVDEH